MVDRMLSLRKIPTRLRGTNFCNKRPFCTEFCKATKRSRMHPNSMKHTKTSVWGPQGWSGVFVAKNSDATSWHKLLHSSARFAPTFVRQPNGPQCTQIVRNAPKRQFGVLRGGSGAFVAKNSDATSWHENFALVRPVLHRVS